jgi:hypothetical protein
MSLAELGSRLEVNRSGLIGDAVNVRTITLERRVLEESSDCFGSDQRLTTADGPPTGSDRKSGRLPF